MANRLLIIADDYAMAMEYAREHGLGHPGEGWRYVYAPWQVLGLPLDGRYVVLTADGLPSFALQTLDALRRKGWRELDA